MSKYWTIIKTEVSRQFTYRFNIVAFVVGNLLQLIAQIVIWTAIYKNLDMVKGYSYEEMLSYVVVGWFFMFISTNYGFESNIARDIHEGTLSNFISKPISYLKYSIARASGRIFIALLVVLLQAGLMFFLFSEYLLFTLSWPGLAVLAIMLILVYLLKLFLAILVGMIAFWTIDITGVYASFNILVKFLSGAYFPINLLPRLYVNISLLFPFAYTFYFPARFYIGKIDMRQALGGILVQLFWLIVIYYIIKIVWQKGIKKYESVGV